VNYRGYDVYELPPNGQGIAALQILNILEGFDLKSLGYNSPQALHLMIEAKKLAFEDRAKFYADPGLREGAGRGIDLEEIRGGAAEAD
jgi:gamma-glutamyltranspeptidase/glutathione hydrolase